MPPQVLSLILALLFGHGAPAAQKPDILLADFEGADYGKWVATGEAFGPGPARGTLPNQQAVTGFRGQRLVNTFFKGDGSTGTLTSPPFAIERKHINFLIGGGNHAGRTCINLLVDGKVVRSTAGMANERLEWATWVVEDLAGKTAKIEIVDRETGGWGHINVDEISLSDEPQAEVVKTGPLYEETYRPQYHFTAKQGWLNDPNGLVYLDGEFHLFFQHNPKSTQWGNMTWGHAVSKDLLHWRQLPNALEPDRMGTMFSGSAVVDENNTAGFGKNALVCIYTAAGGTSDESKGQPFTQCIAYSLDRGRTFTKYAGNPVLPHVAAENRDPKVIWHAPSRRWIMALYLTGNEFALYSSPDLKKWNELQRLTMPDCIECPDFFPIAVEGEAGTQKWVFTAANGRYWVGDFDGAKFTYEGRPLTVEHGANSYAVQTYDGIPASDGRRIQIAWMNGGTYPQMPFNQQMSIPCELTLRRTPAGLRLFKQPVRELTLLRGMPNQLTAPAIPDGSPIPKWKPGQSFEANLEVEIGGAEEITLTVFGEPVTYAKSEGQLKALGRSAPLKPADGKLRLQVLVDRGSLEIFANGGEVTLTSNFLASRRRTPIELRSTGGKSGPVSLIVWPISSVWK